MSRPLLPIERMVLHDRLLEFETLVPMTVSERSALRRWVKGGHDINSNPWNFYDADGWEMSYLEASAKPSVTVSCRCLFLKSCHRCF